MAAHLAPSSGRSAAEWTRLWPPEGAACRRSGLSLRWPRREGTGCGGQWRSERSRQEDDLAEGVALFEVREGGADLVAEVGVDGVDGGRGGGAGDVGGAGRRRSAGLATSWSCARHVARHTTRNPAATGPIRPRPSHQALDSP